MIGYTEEEYNVIHEFKHEENGKKHTYELRQKKDQNCFGADLRFADHFERMKTKNPDEYNRHLKTHELSLRPYISIDIINENDQYGSDLLLFYPDSEADILVYNDWNSIITDKKINLKDLSHDSWIEDHCTGYDLNGGVTMW
jgi:hypothetical protein